MNRNRFFFYIKEYLAFSRSERNGILILLAGIVIIFIFQTLDPKLYPSDPKIDINKFNHEIALFEKSIDSSNLTKQKKYNSKDTAYRSVRAKKIKANILIEINTADSTTLLKLPGIGPVFANRLIKYRNLLGGYYVINQLTEIYGMSKDKYLCVKNKIVIDTSRITKISINTASFKEINKHPYISFIQTKKIISYRKNNFIYSISQLMEMDAFTSSELTKIEPYISYK